MLVNRVLALVIVIRFMDKTKGHLHVKKEKR